MKKKFGLILCVIMAFVLTMGVLGGCNKDNKDEEDEVRLPVYNPYHASYYISSDIMDSGPLKKSFLYAEENRINVAYPNENYDPNDLDNPDNTEYIFDSTLPSERIILLTEQTQLEEAFEEVPEIDLETQMVIIVLLSRIGITGIWLENIKFENGVLEVIIEGRFNGNGIPPKMRGIVIKLDKMEITETKVTYKKIKK